MSSSQTPHEHDLQLHDDQLEHGWAGELELDDERPSTGLASDPRDRKWMLLGLGVAGVLAGSFVLVAARSDDVAPTHLADASSVPREPVAPVLVEPEEPVEPGANSATSVSIAVAKPAAPVNKIRPRSAPPVPEPTTLASGSAAAVSGSKSSGSKSSGTKASGPSLSEPSSTAPELPEAKATAPALPGLPEPPSDPDPLPPPPEASPDAPADALPDVEAWSDADDEAQRELSEPG